MKNICALHGFLGKPSDWDGFFPQLQAIDLLSIASPKECLEGWGNRLNADQRLNGLDVLLGYSLGGRLAMHALLQEPKRWKAAIIVSAHPGLTTQKEREERLVRDHQWAERFVKEDWNSVMRDWHAQPLFKDSHFNRQEGDFSRPQLAAMLRQWSVGHQKNLKQQLEEVNVPVLWIAGAEDPTYATIARSISFAHPKSQIWIASEVAHRVPWAAKEGNQKKFISQCSHFLKEIGDL